LIFVQTHRKKLKKKFRNRIYIALTLGLLLIFTSHWVVELKTNAFTFSDVNQIPENQVGIVLGTSKLLKGNRKNLYFDYRMDAVEALYRAKKIKYIIVSGDNSRKDYNEPLDMQHALIAKGIPKERIFLDYAGFSTIETVQRAKLIFGQSKFTLISQDFHVRRAVYTANYLGMNAVGYAAKDVDAYYGFKTKIREKLARIKLFLNLWSKSEPTFGGNRIKIPKK